MDTAATVTQRTAGASALQRTLSPIRDALRRLRLHGPRAAIALIDRARVEVPL